MKNWLAAIRSGCVLLGALTLSAVHAEIVTDGTLGLAGKLVGPDYLIPENLGRRVGENLFHSFQTFDLHTVGGASESATFSGSDDIAHVISRVTGGKASEIDGLLRSEIGQADFYFLNPAGVMFGPNAQVDVPGSFHVATADELRLADGSLFSASDPDQSTLGMAPPEAFGYLGEQAASLVINGSTLEFRPGSKVHLSGGNLTVTGARIVTPAGTVSAGAVGDQSLRLNWKEPAPENGGAFQISGSELDTSGDGGGTLILGGRTIAATEARLAADNSGDRDSSGEITLQTGRLSLIDSRLSSDTWGSGDAGSVNIRSGNIELMARGATTGFVGITSIAHPESTGNAGSITIETNRIDMGHGSVIGSGTFSTGKAGDITVTTDTLNLDGAGTAQPRTWITSASAAPDGGDAGNIDITAKQSIQIVNGATLTSDTYGKGNAGNIRISAGDINLDAQGFTSDDPTTNYVGITSIALPNSTGKAGLVEIDANRIDMRHGSVIGSGSFGAGKAGDISVTTDTLNLDGAGTAQPRTWITTASAAPDGGDAGNIDISARQSIQIRNGATLTSDTYGKGNAGNIRISAGEIDLDAQGFTSDDPTTNYVGITSIALPNSTGKAGVIDIEASGRLSIRQGSVVGSGTFAAGDAGSISVHATSILLESLIAGEPLTWITSYAANSSTGKAGSIAITGNHDLVVRGGRITTDGNTQDGGLITIENVLTLLQNGQLSTSTDGGNGGDIRIDSDVLVMDTGFIQANTASGADGGDIVVDVPYLLTPFAIPPEIGGLQRETFVANSGRNIIQAAAPEGNPGTLTLSSPEFDISGSLATLASGLADAARVAEDPCAALWQGTPSTLVAATRGGLPGQDAGAPPSFAGARLQRPPAPGQDPDASTVPAPISRVPSLALSRNTDGCQPVRTL